VGLIDEKTEVRKSRAAVLSLSLSLRSESFCFYKKPLKTVHVDLNDYESYAFNHIDEKINRNELKTGYRTDLFYTRLHH
jgi:hypothetical protein